MAASTWVHLENCDVLRDSEMAILVEYGGERYWLPRSQVSEGHKYEAGDRDVTISITEFIAGEKGIEVE